MFFKDKSCRLYISEYTMVKKDHKKIDSILKKIYYNEKGAAAFTGPDKLYRVLKSKGVSNIGKYTIRQWLQNQDDYSLQKPVRQRFKKARVVVAGIDDQFDADLADVSNISSENDGFKYLLFVIDIFSKYLWIVPMKNKTAKEVVKGFKHVFGQRKSKKLRTDNGKEFTSNITRTFLKNQGVYYFTTQNSNTKANIAERVIQTIKNMMYRYFTKNRSHRYIDILQDMVNSYNATPHRSLNNMAPNAVNKNNEADIWAYMYLKPNKTKKNVTRYQFKKDDLVRISHKNMVFDRSYDEHFTREIFKINQRMRMQGIPVYKIKDFQDEPIKGNFYESELQKVNKDVDAMWFIEKKIRKRKKNGKIEWLVKFDGWPDKFNQWIAEKDITDVTDTTE